MSMVANPAETKNQNTESIKEIPANSSLAAPGASSEAWKVVGSPARRASINPTDTSTPDSNDVQSKEAMYRARAASIPGYMFPVDRPQGPAPPGLGESSQEPLSWNTTSAAPSIWTNGTSMTTSSQLEAKEIEDRFNRQPGNQTEDITLMTEEEYNEMPKGRSRSKSSSAIFGVSDDDIYDGRHVPDISSIWRDPSQTNPPLLHRRASTQPSQQTLMWEALRAAQLATPQDLNGANTNQLMDRFKQEQAANLRRFSVAPSMVNRFMNRHINQEDTVPSVVSTVRRHSMAGPMFDRKLNTKLLSEGLEKLGVCDPSQQLEQIDDYFENTESRTRAFMEAGKNLQAIQAVVPECSPSPVPPTGCQWPIYVVEFKAGRTDYFYVPDEYSNRKINVGDLAIVEADRGKDLGKIIENNINSMAELQMYQTTHVDPLVDSHNGVGKEFHPKRIHRIAEPSEVAMLIAKSQDEAKANGVCQVKIRQKKLPMEIVDAEYQWDRRKLTFYFVAERRIDFRELVRELFKIYKTRIWMCAVNPREMAQQ